MEAAAVDGDGRTIFGLIGFGEIAEDCAARGRNSLHPHKASGDIVLVKIDDASLREIGRWPWPRRNHAQLIDRLTAAGAKRIFFDINLFVPDRSGRRPALAERSSGPGGSRFSPARRPVPRRGAHRIDSRPLPMFAKHAKLGSISVAIQLSERGLAAALRGQMQRADGSVLRRRARRTRAAPATDFTVDYSIDPQTIPSISAGDVLNGTVYPPATARQGRARSAPTSDVIGDHYLHPRLRARWAASTSISSAPRR